MTKPSETPLVICRQHNDEQAIVAFADGSVKTIDVPPQATHEELVTSIIGGEPIDEVQAIVLENARKRDRGIYD